MCLLYVCNILHVRAHSSNIITWESVILTTLCEVCFYSLCPRCWVSSLCPRESFPCPMVAPWLNYGTPHPRNLTTDILKSLGTLNTTPNNTYLVPTHAFRVGERVRATGYLATYMCGGTRVRGWRVRRVAMGAGTRHGRADCRPGGRAAGCPGSGVRRLITLCSLELAFHVK